MYGSVVWKIGTSFSEKKKIVTTYFSVKEYIFYFFVP